MRNTLVAVVFAGLGLALAGAAASPLAAGPPVVTPDPQPGIEVQARGPIHEAFARPVSLQPEPGPLVPQAPPGSRGAAQTFRAVDALLSP